MDAVSDQFYEHFRGLEDGWYRPRLAMADGAHGIPQVRGDAGPGCHRRECRLVIAGRVPDSDPYVCRRRLFYRRQRPRKPGARVTIRIWPAPAASSSSISTAEGDRKASGACAPHFSCAIQGPSRWMPAIRPAVASGASVST